jgi:hypothetical protein
MKPTPTLLAAAFLVTSVAIDHARADAPGVCDCAVTPADAAPAPTRSPQLPRWGVGAHVAALSLDSEMWSEPSGFTGAGIHLRVRLWPRWVVEGTFAHVADDELGDARDVLSVAVQFHPRPTARWDLYALAGAGQTFPGIGRTYHERGSTQDPNLQLGGGVERRVGDVGLAAEVRLLRGTASDDATGDVTTEGVLATAGASYYF